MNRTMKKKISYFCIFMIICLLSLPAQAVGEGYSWYIRRAKEHAAPGIEAQTNALLKKYDGYYLNNACLGINGEKVIYLTFDVGYENGNVGKTLDILKEENVKGSFFVLSHFLKSAPNIAKKMVDEGHLVCNHTASHKNSCNLNEEELRREIQALEEVYENLTNKKLSPYFRPPEGKYDEKTLALAKKMGYKTVFWSLAYADWDDSKAPSDEKAKQILMDNTHNGAIVLIHPTSDINVRILKDMIHYWKNEGYRFGSLEELKGQL